MMEREYFCCKDFRDCCLLPQEWTGSSASGSSQRLLSHQLWPLEGFPASSGAQPESQAGRAAGLFKIQVRLVPGTSWELGFTTVDFH